MKLEEIPSRVYSGISFLKGEMPNLDILKSSFIEEGIFINNKGESPVIKPVLEYIGMIQSNVENGNIVSIRESEIKQSIQVFGKVAQIVSEYELVFEGSQGTQTRYGVNLFQLISRGGEWLVSSMCWDDKLDKSLLSGDA